MAYTDSLQIRTFTPLPTTTAALTFVNDLDSGVSIVRCPTGAQLETFGVQVFSGGPHTAPACQVAVLLANDFGSIGTVVATLTLPLRTLVSAERFESGVIGGRATRVLPGQVIRVQFTVAAGGGAAQIEEYIVLRIDGYSAGLKIGGTGQVNANSPLTVLFS